MSTDIAMKVDADHLRRDAFLYMRQSSLRQVFENTESTKRQIGVSSGRGRGDTLSDLARKLVPLSSTLPSDRPN
jgi:hypothetical protein